MSHPFLVGVAGGSGSGKTHFLKSLQTHFSKEELCVVTQDNYYLNKSKQPTDEKGVENFDTPESVDSEKLFQDLLALKNGKSITLPEYTFNNPGTVSNSLTFHPAPIVVVEGIMIYHYKEIDDLFDFKIFIEALEIIKLKRRIMRDEKERGYDIKDVLYRYEHHVTPNYDTYIKPQRGKVDLIIPNNHDFGKALEVLVTFFKSRLEK